MEKLKKLIKKICTKEVILYIVFGVLTTLVNIGSFYVMNSIFNWNENTSNIIAISLAVLVAYFTNKDLVFHSQAKDSGEKFIEFCKFVLGRLFTMAVEYIGCAILFKYSPIPIIFSKCAVTVLVIILNFFISKSFAFNEKITVKRK